MTKRVRKKGFTLVELIVALIVTGIILSAVATLAFALNSVNDATDDTDRTQAHVRYATLKISELIRYSRLVCFLGDEDIVLWSADTNGNNQINISELVYIEKGPNSDHLRIYEFPESSLNPNVSLGEIDSFSSRWWSSYVNSTNEPIDLISECSNVQFRLDNEVEPSRSKFVNISFDLTENGLVRQYHIDSALRCWAGHLLNATGSDLISDDD